MAQLVIDYLILTGLVAFLLVGCASQPGAQTRRMPLPCTVTLGPDGKPRMWCSSAGVTVPAPF